MLPIEYILLGAAGFLLLGIIASKASGRLGVPALVLFLLIGMLAGSDGPGGIYFDDPWLAQAFGVVALALILFAGGLDTDWQRVRPMLARGAALATVGVLLTALAMGVFAWLVLGFSPLQGLLLGAIISSTDAAAVFTVLRSRGVRLRDPLEPLLELESGSNDPMAVFLTLGITGLLTQPDASPLSLIPMFLQQMLLGAAFGFAFGRLMRWIINRVNLHFDGLYPVLTLALVFLAYSGAAALGGNGFLAVYLAGIVLAQGNFIHKRSLARFHDGLAWLMQITMFLTLGLLVFPSRLPAVAGTGLLAAAFLIFVARPLGILLTLLPKPLRLRWPQMGMVAWVGLRGAVPIILATFPRLAGVPQAERIFDVVLFITLTSVLLQGTSIPLVARWLKVDVPAPGRLPAPLTLEGGGELKSSLLELVVPPESAAAGRQVVELGLPRAALVVLIGREGTYVVPNGSTALAPGDHLLIMVEPALISQVRRVIEARSESAAKG